MKRVSLCVLGLLIGSAAIVPLSASAATGLQVLLFLSPTGRVANETIDVNVEAYLNGVPVDLDTLTLGPGYAADPLNFTNLSTGKYHASYMINASDIIYGTLIFFGSADVASDSATLTSSYSVGGGFGGSDWSLTMRPLNSALFGGTVGPGATVEFEARAYHNGVLAEGGPINITATWTAGGTTGNSTLSATKTADGIYHVSVVVPSDLTLTRMYQVEATLGTGLFAPSASSGLTAHPFPIYAVVKSSTAVASTLKVYAGGSSPMAGANVSLEGTTISLSYPFSMTPVGPFTATTDVNGQATVTATTGLAVSTLWYLNVTSGGKTTSTPVALIASSGPGPWMPSPPIGFGCEVNVQTDPSTIQAGHTVNLVFRVTAAASILNPLPVVSQNIDRYVWKDGAGGTSQGGTVMTDASGNFTLVWAVPANWTSDDTLKVRVVCPDGTTGSTQVQGGGSGGPFESGAVSVTASGKLGDAVTITAVYSGSNPLTGAVAFASIVPGNMTNLAGVGFAGGGLSAPLTRSGSTFTGSVTVPTWFGEGDFDVIVIISNAGATNSKSDQTTEGNATTMHLTPQGSTGGNSNPAPKGFLPGFEGAAAVAALGALAIVLIAGRRRRAD